MCPPKAGDHPPRIQMFQWEQVDWRDVTAYYRYSRSVSNWKKIIDTIYLPLLLWAICSSDF